MSWEVILSKQAIKDVQHIKQAGLAKKLKVLLVLLQHDPFTIPPRYEPLVGNLKGFYSRRISIKHRLVYAIDVDKRVVHVLRCWTHYE
ncbi:MAG: Txe/YoeB family addiction module toxin [Proteobacteria bacterium]|nr:Txe/YoeB family addiction module toxin [bacterium AH-315-G11]PCI43741.1 MAG: Txe/YoeB family addiction module toxin [Pseudomonadota bacterium]